MLGSPHDSRQGSQSKLWIVIPTFTSPLFIISLSRRSHKRQNGGCLLSKQPSACLLSVGVEVSKQQKKKGDIKTVSSYSITHLPWGLFVPLFMGFNAAIIGSVALVTQLSPISIEYQLYVHVYGWVMTLRYILWSLNQFCWLCNRVCDAFQVHPLVTE